MYKVSVAISIKTINDESIAVYLDQLKKAKVDRLFLCGMDFIYKDNSRIITEPERVKYIINYFKDNGLEVGVWISGLGHGCMLPGMELSEAEKVFTNLKGVDGTESVHGFCPSDENFRKIYGERVKLLAELGPDLIQLDDDFRLNYRQGVTLACFCDKHLKDYYERIGEEIPLEEIKKHILTGGKNKYRTAYMNMCRDTLLDFARFLRLCVDEVNPDIRLASCGTHENWDAAGTDMIELAKAFAGNTTPFMRTNAGPYWHKGGTHKTLIDIIEFTRMQAEWCKGSGIEVFAEGDTFPRPRYNVSASLLELFDLPLFASTSLDGNLKYMFDYLLKPDYETGYLDSHIRNEKIRDGLAEIFKGKTPVGPRVVTILHTAENMDVPEEYAEERFSLKDEYRYLAVLPSNSIPTSFENGDYPAFVVGENAKYVTEEDLKNGAILDVKAADILNRRGFDTGLISFRKTSVNSETYLKYDDVVGRVDTGALYEVSVKDGAEVLSTFMPSNTPGSFIYNNFCVMAADLTYSYVNRDSYTKDYFLNYYRQADLIYALEKIGGKKLPVVSRKHPYLYTLASKNENSMAVIFSNIHEDGVYGGRFELDKKYSSVKFVNCSGRLENNSVIIDEITPFGVAAFEVK